MLLYYYDSLNTHLFLRPLSSHPSKKKQLFFIHFAFRYPFQKSVVLVLVDVYLLLDKVRKKKKYNAYGLTCNSDNKTDERCHRPRNRRKKLL